MTASVSVRGDFDQFNIAKYLWSIRERQTNGRDFKEILGPDSFEYKWRTSKAQSELNGQDGGFLAPEEWSGTFHDVIRDNSAFRSLPVQRNTTSARVHHMAVAMSDWTFSYGLDNSSATSADRKFAMRTLTMRKATALATVSNELLKDASDLANQVLRQSAAEAVAFETDKQTLWGSGQAGTPVGILNMTNVGLANPGAGSGTTPLLADLASMVTKAKSVNNSANVPVGSVEDIAVVAHPRIEQTWRAMVNIANQSTSPWLFGLGTEPITRPLGVSWILTGAIPITFTSTNVSTGGANTHIFAGDWRRLRVTMRLDFEFSITQEGNAGGSTGFQSDQSLVRIVSRYDVSATHPEAFFVLTNCAA